MAHVRQVAVGYCLPACAQMALARLGISATQERLAKALGTQVGIGAPFSGVELLAGQGVGVQVLQSASITDLRFSLASGDAVIVAVTTTPGLPGWGNIRTQHTLLVSAIGDSEVTDYDPALPRSSAASNSEIRPRRAVVSAMSRSTSQTMSDTRTASLAASRGRPGTR